MSPAPTRYFDRRRGCWCAERVWASGFLRWIYNTRAGAAAGRVLTGSPHASRLYGWFSRRSGSRRRIRRFVEEMEVDLTGCVKGLHEYSSFAEFFRRELHEWARPVVAEMGVLVCPADGRVLVYPAVEAGTAFRIKRASFQLRGLLRDDALAALFDGGAMAVVRLGLGDYHHVHFPDSGVPGPARAIPGRYDAGGPYALGRLVPFFTENHRMLTRFATDHFGEMAIVEVGALTVGSIRQVFRAEHRVGKGERKAGFELGGSTVVLLFRPGTVAFDADLVALSAQEFETHVRMGESLGRVP